MRRTLCDNAAVLRPLFRSYGIDFAIPGEPVPDDVPEPETAAESAAALQQLRLHSAS